MRVRAASDRSNPAGATATTDEPGHHDRWDRCWVPAVAGLLLAAAFAGALLVRADGDASLLVHAGPPWTDPATAPPSLTVQDADGAFDGQFFYRLGVEPWSEEEVVSGVTFDLPSLRNARWGYGALAWVASGGDRDLVPWALLGLNVAAAAAVGALGGGLARSSGRHAGWGILLVLWPGFAYSISLDTSELVASTFLLGGLLALRSNRWWPAAGLLAAAVITRDTTTVVPFGVAVAGGWQEVARRRSGGRDRAHGVSDRAGGWLLAGGAALAVFVGWQLLQRARFGELPLTSSGDNNLAAPLVGLARELGAVLPPDGADEAFRLLSAIGLVALLLVGARSLRRTTATFAERTAWVPAVAVVALLDAYLWSGATAFMRAATEAGLLSIIVVLGSPDRRVRLGTGVGLSALWALTAVAQLTKLG